MPSERKPNPENCKNCSSVCAYDCAQLQYTIQRRTKWLAKWDFFCNEKVLMSKQTCGWLHLVTLRPLRVCIKVGQNAPPEQVPPQTKTPRTCAPGEMPLGQTPPCSMKNWQRRLSRVSAKSFERLYSTDMWRMSHGPVYCCLIETKLYYHNSILICLCRTHKLYSVVHHGALGSLMKRLSCLTLSKWVAYTCVKSW